MVNGSSPLSCFTCEGLNPSNKYCLILALPSGVIHPTMELELIIFPFLENPIPTHPLVYRVDATIVTTLSFVCEYYTHTNI